MIVLLLSILITGIFLPITGFAWPAWIIGLLIPMTSAIDGFQHLMLAGTSTTTGPWNLLGGIALLSYDLVSFVMRLQ